MAECERCCGSSSALSAPGAILFLVCHPTSLCSDFAVYKETCANILLGRAKHAWCTTPSMPYSNPRTQHCHDSIFFASAGSTHTEGIIPIPEVQRRTRLRFSQPASEHMHCVSPEFFRGPLLGHFLCAVAQESCQIPAWLLLWSKRS